MCLFFTLHIQTTKRSDQVFQILNTVVSISANSQRGEAENCSFLASPYVAVLPFVSDLPKCWLSRYICNNNQSECGTRGDQRPQTLYVSLQSGQPTLLHSFTLFFFSLIEVETTDSIFLLMLRFGNMSANIASEYFHRVLTADSYSLCLRRWLQPFISGASSHHVISVGWLAVRRMRAGRMQGGDATVC